MAVLGVAVWGLGRHALKKIIPSLFSVKELSLVGVCSRDHVTVMDCSSKWNCIGWTDHTKMLKSTRVDIVYIATPIGVHANQTAQALEAGKHVWCEKPLTCNYEDTELLLLLSKRGNRMLAECFMYLHHPQFRRVLEFVNDNETGHIHSIICRFGIPFLDDPGFRHNPELCGGALWDVGTYTISAVLAIFPHQEVKVLFSEICKKNDFPVDIEGRAILSFLDGTKAYLEWAIGVGYKNEIELWAENGTFYTEKIFSKPEYFQPVFRLRDKNGNETLEYGEHVEQFDEMFRNFHAMLNDKKLVAEERTRILQRAKLMNEIIQYSENNI